MVAERPKAEMLRYFARSRAIENVHEQSGR